MTEPVITTEHVSFAYNGDVVLDDVNMAVEEMDFVGLVGPNGGGKTTLLKLMLGLLQPTAGRIRVFGQNPTMGRRMIGYLPQHARIDPRFPVSVMDVVLMGRVTADSRVGPYRRGDRDAAVKALQQVSLYDLRRRPFAELSGGQQQRVLIARALAAEPRMLLLDEPTAGLDLKMEEELYTLLSELNRRMTVVLVSHDLGFVSRFVRTVVCVKRRVVVHPTSEITGEIIREIYGADVLMVRHDRQCPPGDPTCWNS